MYTGQIDWWVYEDNTTESVVRIRKSEKKKYVILNQICGIINCFIKIKETLVLIGKSFFNFSPVVFCSFFVFYFNVSFIVWLII
jgi:hypothetical protein